NHIAPFRLPGHFRQSRFDSANKDFDGRQTPGRACLYLPHVKRFEFLSTPAFAISKKAKKYFQLTDYFRGNALSMKEISGDPLHKNTDLIARRTR
ncbi:MAG: hypothetical protein AAFQ96_06825, partial [Pseudomonadota bacterium]